MLSVCAIATAGVAVASATPEPGASADGVCGATGCSRCATVARVFHAASRAARCRMRRAACCPAAAAVTYMHA